MKKYPYWLFLLLLFFQNNIISAQERLLNGVVCDSVSGEFLTGAVIMDIASNNATTTNQYGYFTLAVACDTSRIRISYVGYLPGDFAITHIRDTLITFKLSSSNELAEVVVFGNKPMQSTSGASEISVPISLSKSLPSFIGEPDVFKTIQHFPGVQSGVEGSSGLHVRGGSPDQNLVLLNEMPVYNVGHLLGFFSVFNNDAIRNVTFIKGGLPARYSGRLSSVIDVKTKEGNLKTYSTTGNIGLLSSQITTEGPVVNDKLGFMLSARRTYYDFIFSPIIRNKTNSAAGYHFYDLNGSLNYKINKHDQLYYSFYNGIDRAKVVPDTESDYTEKNKIKWGNNVHALRWNHIYKNGLFSNLTLGFSKYKYANERTVAIRDSAFTIKSNGYDASIRDLILKYNLEQTNIKNHELRYGFMVGNHYYRPGETFLYSYESSLDTTIIARNIRAWEMNAYIEDKISIKNKLEVNMGINASAFFVDGTSYYSADPRLSFLYRIGKRTSIKGAYSKTTQYVGLLTSTSTGLPNDLWIPITRNISPLKSNQYNLGCHYNSRWVNFTTEIFYKDMQNLVEFGDGMSNMLGRVNWDEMVSVGSGEAYGIEFLAEKNLGKVNGWISYTLSKNQRYFPDLDPSFPYKYDRRHNLSLSGVYNINKKHSISASWVYYSGEYITLPELRYLSYPAIETGENLEEVTYLSNYTIEVANERNNYQLEPYHRLDLGYSIKLKRNGRDVSWNFGIYNVYLHRNNFFTILAQPDPDEIVLLRYSIIPFLPYFRYEFKF